MYFHKKEIDGNIAQGCSRILRRRIAKIRGFKNECLLHFDQTTATYYGSFAFGCR